METTLLEQQFLIVTRASFEQFRYDSANQTLADAALADREQLECLAKIKIRIIDTGSGYRFGASPIVAWAPSPLMKTGDLRDGGRSFEETLRIYFGTSRSTSNVAFVQDMTNSAIEGWGINSWLIDQALSAFMRISGPDPWLHGKLSPVDAHNNRRLPFWRRHVDHACTVTETGDDEFLGPWIRGHNPYRQKHEAILLKQRGEFPYRTADHGLKFFPLNGRIACQIRSEHDSESFWQCMETRRDYENS